MLQRGDVVNLKPEYVKYALSNGVHYGEDIAGRSWVIDWIHYSENSQERLIFAKPCDDSGAYLEMINGAAIPEKYLQRNDFLTAVYQAQTSGSRRST